MKKLPSFGFRFSRTQKAVLFFLTLLLCTQSVVFFFVKTNENASGFFEDKVLQAKWDASMAVNNKIIYPFNPNYISSYKAYQLELTPKQYEAILAWRKKGFFFQNLEEFRAITSVSNDWTDTYAPFFKWPKNKKAVVKPKRKLMQLGELNAATLSDLRKVNGVGEVLSQRILRYKKRLGGFASLDQLHEVYGLDSAVVKRMSTQFSLSAVSYTKIDFQTASLSELAALPYLSYQEAKQLVRLRTHSDTLSFQGLKKALKWDSLKFQRLALYLY